MILLSANNALTNLSAGISSSATTIGVTIGTGALFPSPGTNEYFTLTLNDTATGDVYEVCWCTARTGDSLTVLRGQEGSTAVSWLLGDFAYNANTAVSISTARAFAATNNPTLPFTIPAAHQGVTQLCGTTGTITLPAVAGIQDGFLCPIVCTSGSATITVNTNSATVALPSGSVTSTFPLAGAQTGVFLQWNATAAIWYSIGSVPAPHGSQSWLAAGTYSFTVPAFIYQIFIEGTGAGGGAGGAANVSGAGGGGEGAEYRNGWFSVTPGQVLVPVVGAGGTGGSGAENGANGTATSVAGFLTCNPGHGGGYGDGFGGAGGSGSAPGTGGTTAIPGYAGGPGGVLSGGGLIGGFQGPSYSGAGSPGGTGASLIQGGRGAFPGVGGQGGITVSSGQTQQGGDGADGAIFIRW